MEKILLLRVHFLDDRYHGEGDSADMSWPPSPARVFQALVAGNAVGALVPTECAAALRWLEREAGAPEIRAHRARAGLPYVTFVPNNDLDAKGGDPAQVADIRVGKRIWPRHIEATHPVVYGWRFSADAESERAARVICAMSENLYQLGRGVDMAWSQAEVLDAAMGRAALEAACGEVWRPAMSGSGTALSCPHSGSLDSLLLRYEAHRQRFGAVKEGKKTKILFTNPPKPSFRQVPYNATAAWQLFDLRADRSTRADRTGSAFRSWPQEHAVALVEKVRDAAAARLASALPDQVALIERLIIGRGASAEDKLRRVRLLPLPSIGHAMTNRSIRRLLLLVPPDCPLRFGDLEWAFSGVRIDGGGNGDTLVVPSDDPGMLRYYGIEGGDDGRLWRSVTPVVLPESAARRRIEPTQRKEQWKAGSERATEEERACAAVLQALRHADVTAPVESIRVQREPFSGKGVRAERFADGTRFGKERLWHVEVRFRRLVDGPLVIGDGRYLGLGLLAPERERSDVLAFAIVDGLAPGASAEQVAAALRRAVMARVQALVGQRHQLEPFFTGHASDGAPLRSGTHRHLAFVADLKRARLLVIPPHLLEGRSPFADERRHLKLLEAALDGMDDLRAGVAGRLQLNGLSVDLERDALFGAGRIWESMSDYRPTRHAKKSTPEAAIAEDVRREIRRRRLPEPEVEVLAVKQGPRGGLTGRLQIRFQNGQRGPLLIGRTRHLGGGLFARMG